MPLANYATLSSKGAPSEWPTNSAMGIWVFVLLLLAVAGYGQTSTLPGVVQKVHQSGPIRVFYYTAGQHAVDLTDRNTNGIPDQVEDVLTQTLAAQTLFVDVLGFPDPFKTEQFRAARFLDIHFRHKDLLKNNGVAYDELQRYKRPGDAPGTLSLCFNVATSVKPASSLTPAHEYFHLIEYGLTRFKRRWLTEGMARWSEGALGAGGLGRVREPVSLPLAPEKRAALVAMSYEASEHFWNPLASRTDPSGLLPHGPQFQELQAMTYVDGTQVLKDDRLSGWRFMRAVLLELEKADQQAYARLGYTEWSEVNQNSPKNDPFILEAVMRVLAEWK
jgi:hypothetical protein